MSNTKHAVTKWLLDTSCFCPFSLRLPLDMGMHDRAAMLPMLAIGCVMVGGQTFGDSR